MGSAPGRQAPSAGPLRACRDATALLGRSEAPPKVARSYGVSCVRRNTAGSAVFPPHRQGHAESAIAVPSRRARDAQGVMARLGAGPPAPDEDVPAASGTWLAAAPENLRHFHDQDGDWRAAEQDIIASREAVQRTRPPGTGQLGPRHHTR